MPTPGCSSLASNSACLARAPGGAPIAPMVLCGLAEVLFDTDRGHQVEAIWPEGLLSAEELSDVAFNSFPDSLSLELRSTSSVRDSSFCFRLRRRALPGGGGGTPPQLAYIYGHVFCRQRQDDRLRRGCEQKAVVLLSWLPLYSVLEPLARLVGPTVLSYGRDALRQIWEEVAAWPPLEWGCRMELPLLGIETVDVQLPLLTSLPTSALPAAVAAGLGQYAVAAALGRSSDARSDGGAGGGDASSAGSEAAAEAERAAEPAAGQQQQQQQQQQPVAATPHLLVASPAQVATALADELDASGLPLGLLPQAYGQQELEASAFGDCDCFTPLREALPQLWSLWELLLLGEPLMVAAPSPGACSAAVAALLSLLAPFPYSLDWRPYFTIHDPAFARLAAGELPTAANALPMCMGVTNLYFLKALPDWPNVLSTGYTATTMPPSSSSEQLEGLAGSSGSAAGSAAGSLHPSESGSTVGGSSGSSLAGLGSRGSGLSPASGSTSRLGGMLRRRPASPAALLSGSVDHCWLAYKPLSRPDRTVLDRLVQPQPTDPADKWRRLAAVNSAMLRRHFQELTKALLQPLLPYISPSLPPRPAGQASGDLTAPPLKPPSLPRLDADALLARLSAKGAVLPPILLERFGGARPLLQFYQRFLASPNLVSFMHLRRLAAHAWQTQEWEAAATAAAAPMQELRDVESFFHLEQRLAAARQQQQLAAGGGDGGGAADAGAAALVADLQAQLQLAFGELPEDLQAVILHTPSHAALLQPAGSGGGGGEEQA